MLLIGMLIGGTIGYQLGCKKAEIKQLIAKLNPKSWLDKH